MKPNYACIATYMENNYRVSMSRHSRTPAVTHLSLREANSGNSTPMRLYDEAQSHIGFVRNEESSFMQRRQPLSSSTENISMAEKESYIAQVKKEIIESSPCTMSETVLRKEESLSNEASCSTFTNRVASDHISNICKNSIHNTDDYAPHMRESSPDSVSGSPSSVQTSPKPRFCVIMECELRTGTLCMWDSEQYISPERLKEKGCPHRAEAIALRERRMKKRAELEEKFKYVDDCDLDSDSDSLDCL